jgi:multidrug efflux system outer membrane protein
LVRYEAGYSPYLEVLDAQRTANVSELAALRNRQALLSATVDLMRALGGGWSMDRVSMKP